MAKSNPHEVADDFVQTNGNVLRALAAVEAMIRKDPNPLWEQVRSELQLRKNRGEKALDTTTAPEVATGIEQPADEPMGAQVYRRVHADMLALMEEYDAWLRTLEAEKVKSWLEGVLQTFESYATDAEEGMGEYPDSEPLADATEADGGEPEAEGEEKAMDEDPVDGELEATADEETPALPSEDELNAEGKSLPNARTKSNSHSAEYTHRDTMGHAGSNARKIGGAVAKVGGAVASGVRKVASKVASKIGGKDFTEDTAPVDEQINGDELNAKVKWMPHHKNHVGEAHGFMSELPNKESLEDEDRMKAYHYHKALGDVVNAVTDSIPGVARSQGGGKGVLGTAGGAAAGMAVGGVPGAIIGGVVGHHASKDHLEDEEEKCMKDIEEITPLDDDMHPHVKAIKDASDYLGELSRSQDFNDEHKQKAMSLCKALDPILAEEQEAIAEAAGEDTEVEPGDTDTKALIEQARKDREVMVALNKQLLQLNGVIR